MQIPLLAKKDWPKVQERWRRYMSEISSETNRICICEIIYIYINLIRLQEYERNSSLSARRGISQGEKQWLFDDSQPSEIG